MQKTFFMIEQDKNWVFSSLPRIATLYSNTSAKLEVNHPQSPCQNSSFCWLIHLYMHFKKQTLFKSEDVDAKILNNVDKQMFLSLFKSVLPSRTILPR